MAKQAYVVLENRICFKAEAIGDGEAIGEMVFNTSHSGYEEVASDPSYFGQIVTMTSAQQGNYGLSDQFMESHKYHIKAFICLEVQNSLRDSAWAQRLVSMGCPVVHKVDTRSLVFELRKGTSIGGVIMASDETQAQNRFEALKANQVAVQKDWTLEVSTPELKSMDGSQTDGPHVGVLDFGCKQNIIRELKKSASKVSLIPSTYSKEQVLALNLDGLLLSNGPGDPAHVLQGTELVKNLLGELPIFGICMGHQVLAQALGARTYPLKFGHRGSNHPVKDLLSDEIYMTSQNHGYAVDMETLPKGVKLTHLNLNDNSVSGIEVPDKKAFSVQFHPESHPGPNESVVLFQRFFKALAQ